MTPEQEAEMVDKIAAEICYAAFVPPIDYGGPKVYWRTVVPKKKEVYRREARAALRIAKPIIRDEALEDAAVECRRCAGRASWETAAAIRALKSKGQKPS